MIAETYEAIIARKSASQDGVGVVVNHGDLLPALFPHQRDLVRWALRKGRSAVFADTGLGKSLMELEWARHLSRLGRVLIATPLAVAEQLSDEGDRFGILAPYRREDQGDPITVTNIDMLHAFDPSRFIAFALDESSILKAYDGATRVYITESWGRMPYRSAWTATPAPNDFTELGTHSAFLGVKSREEMLAEFFVHDGGSTQDWRLKGHAVSAFWRWVSTWGAVVRKPSDLGHDDSGYILPPLRMHEHIVDLDSADVFASGMLFADEARTLAEQRATRRATIAKRVDVAARLCADGEPVLVWCELNDEGDALVDAIPGAVQVRGSDDPETKAARLLGFARGEFRVLVTKPQIASFGLNYQHCARQVFVGASHSYEQRYQAIRRSWRFGQTRPVDAHVIRTEADGAIVANMRRKEADAERLAAEMTAHVGDAVRAEVTGTRREWNPFDPQHEMLVPRWIGEEAAE